MTGAAGAHGQAGRPVTEALVRSHRRFLRFLEARLRDRALAEELLQAAYAKSVTKAGGLRDGESAVAWFYRLLRNAIADHHRRRGREARALERFGAGEPGTVEAEALRAAVCRCVGELVPALKDEYATALRRVDVEEASVPELAAELGITSNAAGVRLHRARQALRKRVQGLCGACATHGCLECSCAHGPARRKGLK